MLNTNMFANFERKQLIMLCVLIFILLILLVLILITLSRSIINNRNLGSITPTPTKYPLPIPLYSPIIPTYPPTPIPQSGDIIIDGIAVNDFKVNVIRTEENGDIVIAEAPEYQITFRETGQKFQIILVGDNFADSRNTAENKLLELLGVDKPTICRLYIEEEVPLTAKNEFAGKVFPFSSCVHEE